MEGGCDKKWWMMLEEARVLYQDVGCCEQKAGKCEQMNRKVWKEVPVVLFEKANCE